MFDLLMYRNAVFRVINVQIWAVPSNKYVDLLIHRNRVFMLRNGEIMASLSRKRVVLLMLRIPFSGCECFKYGY